MVIKLVVVVFRLLNTKEVSLKLVCMFSFINRLAVERRKGAIIASKSEQVQFTKSNFFTT